MNKQNLFVRIFCWKWMSIHMIPTSISVTIDIQWKIKHFNHNWWLNYIWCQMSESKFYRVALFFLIFFICRENSESNKYILCCNKLAKQQTFYQRVPSGILDWITLQGKCLQRKLNISGSIWMIDYDLQVATVSVL